eukprot:4027230-Amphidinium_carterae.1
MVQDPRKQTSGHKGRWDKISTQTLSSTPRASCDEALWTFVASRLRSDCILTFVSLMPPEMFTTDAFWPHTWFWLFRDAHMFREGCTQTAAWELLVVIMV